MKLTTKREELVSKLSIVSRAVSTRAATQALSGVLLTAAEGRVTLAATDLDMGLETTLAAEVAAEGSVLLPGRLLAEVARSLGDASGGDRVARGRARRRDPQRQLQLPPAGPARRGLPEAAGAGRGAGPEDPGQGARRQHRPGRPGRLARRHAPGPDRRLRRRQRLGDDDGRHRLLPAGGQADRARERARRRDRRQHPGPGAARARPHPLLRGRRGGDGLPAAQPGRFRGRGDHPHDAADRGPVPQLSTAPAGVLRARRAAAARRLPRRHPPGQPAGPAQRAAAPLVRAGRADGRGRDARRRRRRGDDAGRLRGRAAGDRLQPGVPQGGHRERRGRRGAAAADLAAAARACCSRSRAKTSATW